MAKVLVPSLILSLGVYKFRRMEVSNLGFLLDWFEYICQKGHFLLVLLLVMVCVPREGGMTPIVNFLYIV